MDEDFCVRVHVRVLADDKFCLINLTSEIRIIYYLACTPVIYLNANKHDSFIHSFHLLPDITSRINMQNVDCCILTIMYVDFSRYIYLYSTKGDALTLNNIEMSTRFHFQFRCYP